MDDDLVDKFWALARQKVDDIKADHTIDGGIDFSQLYSQGCVDDLEA